jgi:hypothetical protein
MKKISTPILAFSVVALRSSSLRLLFCVLALLCCSGITNAQAPQPPILQGPANPCSNSNNGNLSYTITNWQAGVTYTWVFSELTSALPTPILITNTFTSTSNSYSYHWSTNNGGTVAVFGQNGSGTSSTSILIIAPCCYSTTSTNQYVNEPFVINYVTNSINGVSFSNNPNPIYINGILDLLANFTIKNCPNINMGNGSKITVDGNTTLTLISTGTAANRTRLRAGCDWLWNGILLRNEKTKIVVDRASIEDAEIAIECDNGALYTLQNNAVLNKNAKGIVVNSYNASVGTINTYAGSITNSYILCGTVTYNASNANVTSYTSNGVTRRGWRSYLGIEFIGSLIKPTYFTAGSTSASVNTFDNLTIGILNRNASLTAVKNKFSNIKFSAECQSCSGCTGKAICSTNTTANVVTSLIVGNALAANANIFNLCDNGVYVSTNQNVNVKNNTFTYIYGGTVSAPTGSAIDITNCKGVSGYSNGLSVTNNIINHSGLGIWLHNNDGDSTIEILNNSINYNTGYTTIPNGTGIVAQQNSNAASTLLYVNTNKVFRLKTGIQIDQFYHPFCGGNLVDYITQVASTTWAYGISVTNSPGAEIKSNTTRSTGTNYWHTGIKSDFCPNSVVSCNKVENIGFGFQIGGTQTGMKFTSNQMITNTVGLGLGYTAIGDQSLVGSTAEPSDNTWSGTFTNHTKSDFSNVSTGYSKLNLQGTQGTIYYPAGMSNIRFPNFTPYNIVVISGNTSGSQPPCAPPPLMAQSGGNSTPVEPTLQEEALDIIGSAPTGALYEDSQKWHDKYFLYSYLKSDTVLVNSDYSITAFEDSAKVVNIGIIEEGEKLLGNLKDADSLEIANKLIELTNTVPDNQVDQNLKDVQMKELEHQISNSGYSLLEINDFKSLAIQCPYEAGVAVFKARIILAGIEGPNKVYVNACERMTVSSTSNRKATAGNFESNSLSNIILSPNPASINFNLDVEGVSNFTGTINIYDLFGKLVFTNILTGSHSEISTKTLNSGFYFYKILDEDNILTEGKLILVK